MDFKSLQRKIENYRKKYNVISLGNSNFGREIFAVEVLKNKHFSTAFLVAGVHAREHITTDLVCKMLDDNLFDKIENFNIIVIPMLNPDGVELCVNGIESAPLDFQCNLIKYNGGVLDFSMWKANGQGVDINNNFDANFGTNTNTESPAPSGYVGEFAESEIETKLLVDLTNKIKPFITISYHSKGEEIYYNFFQDKNIIQRDKLIAERFSESTGYMIKNIESVSSGGYKDYCVQKLKIPALTIEVGSDNLSHPIGKNHLDAIYHKHKSIAKDLDFAYNIFNYFN